MGVQYFVFFFSPEKPEAVLVEISGHLNGQDLSPGPVSHNMEIALRRTYDATPSPKLVVAVGDCGCNGGIFGQSYASLGGVDKVIPVDACIPGCPPTPTALLKGILKSIG